MSRARLALAHEWLQDRCGSEKTFEAMAQAFPEADLYALTLNRDVDFDFGGRPVSTTFLDRVPPPLDRRQVQLPLMPLAWRHATRSSYDVVVTSSHACAKGFGPGRDALHLSYCYTPMRYAWLPELDRRLAPGWIERAGGAALRRWDHRSVAWVDSFAAISTAVRDRVQAFYQRDAEVIHPPVDTDFYTPGPSTRPRDRVLVVSRMVAYKRIDLAIRAAHRLGLALTVAGSGPEEASLRSLAEGLGAHVSFVTAPDDATLRTLYRGASVVVFTSHEDFGIVPVEAQACGTPVVALDAGGTRDTVVDGLTGALVPAQDPEAFASGIQTVLDADIDPVACRTNAEGFSSATFAARFGAWVQGAAEQRGLDLDVAPAGEPSR